ncbi:MAG TPA: TonB-dependent receptor [Candidatus Kapabacteria bacterium]|nr:TonB-dependent receptor [Candidatus Kapabacteria bacterium]
MKILKRSIILVILFSIISISIAKSAGKVTAIILDSQNLSPLIGANAVLHKIQDSSIVTGKASDKNGRITIEDIPNGSYYLRITYIGYTPKIVSPVIVTQKSPNVALDTILIDPTNVNTKEIEVVADKPIMEYSTDKKVFNVSKSLIASGGDALDVLRSIPSIDVDIDNNVSLRGSGNVKITLNGQESAQTENILETIPADMIEKVEVITNPSSKYSPEGSSGIINIILKKNQRSGINGILNANVGTSDKYNTSNNIAYKTGIFNIYGSYMMRSAHNSNTGYNNTYNETQDNQYSILQNSSSYNRFLMHNVRAGVDMNLSNSQTASLEFGYRFMNPQMNNNISNLFSDTAFYGRTNFITSSSSKPENNIIDLTAKYVNQLNKNGEKLNFSANYSGFNNNSTMNVNQTQFSDADFLNSTGISKYRTITDGNSNNYTVKLDYTLPFSEKTKLEAGYNGTFRLQNNEFNKDNYLNNDWLRDSLYLDKFSFNEYYNALYINFGSYIGNFSYQLGTRFEQANTSLDQNVLNKKFNQNYFTIYPSIYLSYNLSDMDKFQLSYTRRVNRPRMHQLNPFIDYSDPLNIRYGNPNLKPEFINAFELGFLKNYTKLTILPEVFYQYTQDVVTPYRVFNSDGTISNSFINLAQSHRAGLDLNTDYTLTRWFRLSANLSYFYYHLVNQNRDPNISDAEDYSYSIKFNGFFTFTRDFNIQLSLNYDGPMKTGQGTRSERFRSEIGIKKDIIKDMLTLNVRLSDIFNTMKWENTTYGNGYYINNYHKPDSRALFIGLSFKFGQNQYQKNKKQDTDLQNNNEDYQDLEEY